tara:strand:+ start:715 stop:2115 length:1401 start_codon:yes stop_codon:yes gene_type:complete
MKHRLFFTVFLTLLGLVKTHHAEEPVTQPNFLFIAIDDLRPELACYGSEAVLTPHIDRLAGQGTVFNRAYCQVAVCGASRASLMTGLRPTPDRFLNYLSYAEKDAPGAMTIAEELKNGGYHTISNGKIFHHVSDTADRSWSEEPWRPPLGGASFLDPDSKNLVGGKKNRGPIFESPDVPDNAYPDGQTADKTIADLRRMKTEGKPFFLACGFFKPHLPFYAPKKYWDLYDPASIDLADNQYSPKNAPESLKGSGEVHSYHNRGMEYNSEAWHRNCRHGYYACVSYIDAQIGRVMEALDELELRDNTVVVIWGDHGWHLGEHNFWGKHNVMHLATRSPLIVAAPGYKGEQTCDRLVEFVDLYPSLCDLAGIRPTNRNLQGTSFAPLLIDPRLTWKEAAFSKFGTAVSLVTHRYNYAEFENGEAMLYDLKNDPDENTNQVASPEYASTVKRLSRLLNEGWTAVQPPQE